MPNNIRDININKVIGFIFKLCTNHLVLSSLKVRFANCYSSFMDIDNLLKVRNVLATKDGSLILDYLFEVATDFATKDYDEKQLKGFMVAIAKLKDVPNKVEAIRSRK